VFASFYLINIFNTEAYSSDSIRNKFSYSH
jgi:hypothetical protein